MTKTTKNAKTGENQANPGNPPWVYKGAPFVEVPDSKKVLGFVYLIRHIESGRGYIGRKLFWFKKTVQRNKKKKKVLGESDWKSYWSSSVELQRMVRECGPQAFTREILHLAKNKGTLNYLEAREQMDRRVLECPDKWINGQIQVRVHHSHIKMDAIDY